GAGRVERWPVRQAAGTDGVAPPGKVCAEPRHPYPRGLLAAVPSPQRAEVLTGIDGHPPRPGRRGPGCSFASRCGFAVSECLARPPEPALIGGRAVRCIRGNQIRSAEPGRPAARPGPAAGRAAATLSLRALSARYGRVQVLSGVELDVPPESCVAVVGESGSGKTTLARCIVGLHSNWTGEITFDGGRLVPGARERPKETLRRV